jgi:hypothetical protein
MTVIHQAAEIPADVNKLSGNPDPLQCPGLGIKLERPAWYQREVQQLHDPLSDPWAG